MGITIYELTVGHKSDNINDNRLMKGPDRLGRTSLKVSFNNNSEKEIKYISISVQPVNRVGDAVGYVTFKVTGPIKPHRGDHIFKENLWRDEAIVSAKIAKADIEYMDGTTESIPGSEIPITEGGCYVATAVYGSYDCPEVWTLRRYRDCTLAETWYGRAFVRVYYAVSPALVRRLGHTEWFRKMWRGKLDRMVSRLQAKGVESTPYKDRKW